MTTTASTGAGGGAEGSGPDTHFLDFELHKVMYDEAESIVREAYRELLKDAVKQRLASRWGARITALAQLAADEAMADTDANFEIQAKIEARNAARQTLEDRIQAIIRDVDSEADAGGGPAKKVRRSKEVMSHARASGSIARPTVAALPRAAALVDPA